MITASTQPDFYQEFLMRRGNFEPSDYGVDLPKQEFTDRLCDRFNEYTKGQFSLDEMLLRPQAALDFCQAVRRDFGWYDVPDDIMLRTVMTRRKNPA